MSKDPAILHCCKRKLFDSSNQHHIPYSHLLQTFADDGSETHCHRNENAAVARPSWHIPKCRGTRLPRPLRRHSPDNGSGSRRHSHHQEARFCDFEINGEHRAFRLTNQNCYFPQPHDGARQKVATVARTAGNARWAVPNQKSKGKDLLPTAPITGPGAAVDWFWILPLSGSGRERVRQNESLFWMRFQVHVRTVRSLLVHCTIRALDGRGLGQ